MPEDEISSPELTQSQPERLILYEGPLGYYFRLAGIEEGAHAVFFNIKRNTNVGKKRIQEAEQSIANFTPKEGLKITGREKNDTSEMIAPQNSQQEQAESSKEVHNTKNIEDLSDEDILSLLEYSNDEIPSFKGDKGRALDYCRRFVDGVCVPIDKVYKKGSPEVKFGFVIPKKGEKFYDFFYFKENNTIYINRDVLAELSNVSPEHSITATTNTREYNNQKHEKRALLWQLRDARSHGMNKIADLLNQQYNGK